MKNKNPWKISTIILIIVLVISLIIFVDINSTKNYQITEVINFYSSYLLNYNDYAIKSMGMENELGKFNALTEELNLGGSIYESQYESAYENYKDLAPKVLNLIDILKNQIENAPTGLFTNEQKETYKRSFDDHKDLINKNLEILKKSLEDFKSKGILRSA